eukprot:3549744-Pyramimonas_sp.AAC.1
MRATAAVLRRSKTALQCYVDDPFMAAFGTAVERSRKFAVAALLWRVLYFDLAWEKAARGTAVDWIGATLAYVYAPPGEGRPARVVG